VINLLSHLSKPIHPKVCCLSVAPEFIWHFKSIHLNKNVMKITEEQNGHSPLSFEFNSHSPAGTDPDENETGIEDEDDLHEVRVGDDVREPDPEEDYLKDEEVYDDDPDPVPSPS
jgi:hypothetical protein